MRAIFYTGKSTWLHHHYPTAVRIDLLLGEEERRFSSYPERIRDVVAPMKPGSTLILDEIQRVPHLLPDVWESKDPETRLKNYITLYLREEVQAEGLVRQISDFARFLEIASFSYGSIWTTTDIAREASVKRTTVDNYLQILQDLLLSFSLSVFSRRAKRRLAAHQKFYFFDVGVFRALRPLGILDNQVEMEGAALEGLIAQHLRAWVLLQRENHTLSFWRTQTKLEVDFVIYGPRGFWAIEVKRSPSLGPDDIKGLLAFQEEYPEARCFFITLGTRRETYRNFPVLPAADFLLQLSPDNEVF